MLEYVFIFLLIIYHTEARKLQCECVSSPPTSSTTTELCVAYEWDGTVDLSAGYAHCSDLSLLQTNCYQNWNVVPECADQEYLYVIRQIDNIGPIDWSSVTVLEIYNEPNLQPGYLTDSDSTANGGIACNSYKSLLQNLPDQSAVTLLSPGVALCDVAPDGTFYFDECAVQHTTFLQQFFDAGCDFVDVVSAHTYQCDFSDVTQYIAELHTAFPNKSIWLTEAGCDDPSASENTIETLLRNYRDNPLQGLERIYWKSTRVAANLIDTVDGGLTTYGLIFTHAI